MILAQCVIIETYKKDKVEEAKDIFSASCATIRDHFGVEIDEHKLSSNRRASLFCAAARRWSRKSGANDLVFVERGLWFFFLSSWRSPAGSLDDVDHWRMDGHFHRPLALWGLFSLNSTTNAASKKAWLLVSEKKQSKKWYRIHTELSAWLLFVSPKTQFNSFVPRLKNGKLSRPKGNFGSKAFFCTPTVKVKWSASRRQKMGTKRRKVP